VRRFGLCLSACLLVSLTAWSGHSPSASRQTLRIWYATDDPVERVWSQSLAGRFEESHAQVAVRLTVYRFDDFGDALRHAISSGNPPDLAYVTPLAPGIPTYAQAHDLADLTSAARTGSWFSALKPGLLAAYNRPFRAGGARSGAVLGVPFELAAAGVLYNRRLLARLHLAVPASLPALETALAIAHHAGYTALGIGNEGGWPGAELYSTVAAALAKPSAIAAEARADPRFDFRAPPFLRAATMLRGWADAGYLTEDFDANDAQEGIDQFFQGRTLFQLVSSSENAQIASAQKTTGVPIGMFAFPAAGGGPVMPVSGYLGWTVPAAGKHRGLAVQFITAVLSPSTSSFLRRRGLLAAHAEPSDARDAAPPPYAGEPTWQRAFEQALRRARPAPFLNAAPVAHLDAVMERYVDGLLNRRIRPAGLVNDLEAVYATGKAWSAAQPSGEL
jgi:raffinose/stachyose/melibiose transport system substrate-binding protein